MHDAYKLCMESMLCTKCLGPPIPPGLLSQLKTYGTTITANHLMVTLIAYFCQHNTLYKLLTNIESHYYNLLL